MSGHSDLCLPWQPDGCRIRDAEGEILGLFHSPSLAEIVCDLANATYVPPVAEAASDVEATP